MPDSPFLSMLGGMGGMLDPAAMRQQKAYDMLGGLGASLLQASAPRVGPPLGFGDILGAGLVGANQAASAGEDKYLKRALTGAQVATAASKLKRDQAWQDMFKDTGAAAPAAAGGAPGSPTPLPGAGGDMAPFRAAIKGNETGGRYDAVGPPANDKGQRGYGAYQVMDFNIGPWTQEVLGKAMTPQEFLANPQAQDAVFDAKFGQYLKQTGNPQDAASMWFSGRPQAQAGGAQDVLGTSVPGYVAKFNQGLPPPAQMPAPPPGLMAGGPPPAQMPGPPQGMVPPGPSPAPMPQLGGPPLGPIAQPPQVAQGDGSGNPVQQAQFTPPPAPAPAPSPGTATLRDIVQSMSPGVRQIVATMGPEKGMEYLLKQAEPVASPALDTATGQVVFVDKKQLGRDPRYQPVDAARLRMEGDRLTLERRRAAVDEANRDVTLGPNGPQINQPVIDAKTAVSAKQGTDAAGKMLAGDYDDARKANTELQTGGLLARTGIAQTKRIDQLLEGVQTGKFAGTTQDILKAAKGVGIDLKSLGITDNTDKVEAAGSLLKQLALTLRNPATGAGMPGNFSNADRQYLDAIPPGIETTPAGRKLIVDTTLKLHQRQIDLAKVANDFMRSPEAKKDPNALYQKLQDYAEANPLFSEKDLPKPSPGSLPMPGKVRRFNPETGTLE